MADGTAMTLLYVPSPWVTLKFIALRRHRTMGDTGLSFLCDYIFWLAVLPLIGVAASILLRSKFLPAAALLSVGLAGAGACKSQASRLP